MAYVLSTDKQITIISALAEGSSIRAIERMTGVHRDTIMRLGVRIGQGCARIMDEKMRNLPCTDIQLDEIWGFVGKKQRHLRTPMIQQWAMPGRFARLTVTAKLFRALRLVSAMQPQRMRLLAIWPVGSRTVHKSLLMVLKRIPTQLIVFLARTWTTV